MTARRIMITAAIHKSFRLFGLDIIQVPPRQQECPPDFLKEEVEIIRAVRPWTMTSPERIYALIQAVRYVSANCIAGAIVECGVWKGGSMAAVARTLLQMQDVSRDLYLFDTFEGMSEPTASDRDYTGRQATEVMRENSGFKCADAPLELVMEVDSFLGIPSSENHFHDQFQWRIRTLVARILTHHLGGLPSRVITVARGRLRHALERIEQVQIAAHILHLQKRSRDGGHTASLPHAALDDGSRDAVCTYVTHGLNERVDSLRTRHRPRPHSANDFDLFLEEVRRTLLLPRGNLNDVEPE